MVLFKRCVPPVGLNLYTQSMNRGAVSQATIQQMLKSMNEWRDRMVSFDGRNRQLFYRNLKTGDVDLTDKSFDTNVLHAVLSGRPSTVSALYPELFKESKREREPGNSSLDDELAGLLEIEGSKDSRALNSLNPNHTFLTVDSRHFDKSANSCWTISTER
jgi:hypothetical protein